MSEKGTIRLLATFLCAMCLVLPPVRVASNPEILQAGATRPLKALFVGNSYTYVNDLPWLVTQLSLSADKARPLQTKMLALGGATLKGHWDSGQAVQLLRQERWDFVVLQEQSMLPITNPEAMHKYVRLFDSEIKKAGAKTVLFLTWARRDRPETQKAIADAYIRIAKEVHALVAPVGLAWEKALKEKPSLALHHKDDSHPGPVGSYLTASVFYAAFYGRSPEGLSHRLFSTQFGTPNEGERVEVEGLTKEDARLVQRIAWEASEAMREALN